jgi:4'-phosphopantetheinyl transferase EntD
VIDGSLPSGVATAEAFGDPVAPPLLPGDVDPAEAARWGEGRRREFAAGRALARRALLAAGLEPVAVARDARGAPVWPPGAVGSVTHCAGYAAAAVGPARRVRALGVDAEPALPLPAGVLDEIALPDERADLRRLARARPDGCWDRLLLCAKEAVYKAWNPLTGRWLGFEDVRITVHAGGTFATSVPGAGPRVGRLRLRGRWARRDGLLLAAAWLGGPGE